MYRNIGTLVDEIYCFSDICSTIVYSLEYNTSIHIHSIVSCMNIMGLPFETNKIKTR